MTSLAEIFTPSNLLDSKLLEVHAVLASYNLDTVILELSKIAKIKYSAEKAKESGVINDSNKHYLDRDFLPPFAIAYFIQQAMWIKCLENISKKQITVEGFEKKDVDQELLVWLNNAYLSTTEQITSIDFLPMVRQAAALARRIKNNQFPYYFSYMQGNVRLFRLMKILEIGLQKVTNDDYDFKASFSKVFNGLDYDLFILYLAIIHNTLTDDFSMNAIKKDYFHTAKGLDFKKEYVDLIFEKIAILTPEEFFKLYENRKKTYVDPLIKNNNLGEKIYYALHQYIPPIYRDKQLCLVNQDHFICPSPDMLDIYFNESLFETIRLQEKGKGKQNPFLSWFGKAFEAYCEELVIVPNKNCNIFFERELQSDSKQEDLPSAADINVLKEEELVLFEVKTITPRVQALITGRESDNEMEWQSVYKKLMSPLVQVYNSINEIKKNPEKLGVDKSLLKGIKNFYPIIVTYFPVYDINTVYQTSCVHEAIDYISTKDKSKFKALKEIGIEEHRFLVIHIYEFELLAELLNANVELFMQCVREMFDENTFRMNKLKQTGENRHAFTREPAEVIFEYMIKAGIKSEDKEVWQHKQGDVLRNCFREVYKEALKKLLIKE